LNHWIDIHSHILPAVDDGSVSMLQTRNMLRIAHEEGIQCIIATPHYGVGCLNTDVEVLKQKLELVRQEAKRIDENFRIELGHELYYDDEIIEHLRKKKALTLAGTRYVLVEFSRWDDYKYIKTGLHRLLIRGYLPILAHVERYDCLNDNVDLIDELIHLGAYMQLDIASITGSLSNRETKNSKKLLDYGLIHLVCTDSHSDHKRAPRMKEGLSRIKRRYGEGAIRQIFIENANKVMNNQFISMYQ
jgi:protein-tyrosine phosphatase